MNTSDNTPTNAPDDSARMTGVARAEFDPEEPAKAAEKGPLIVEDEAAQQVNVSDAGQIKVGMSVGDLDGIYVGDVKEVRATDFLLDRPVLLPDVYVPFDAIQRITDEGIQLKVAAAELEQKHWPKP